MARKSESILVVGDVHGHLQLAFSIAARLQRERVAAGGERFQALFLCGDVGTFTSDAQLDSATLSHGRTNPCEFEFLHQWSRNPPPPWLEWIFRPDGLDLTCPIVMVHGNHEGFEHLATLVSSRPPAEPVAFSDLPPVDALGRVHYLPSGWRVRTAARYTLGGIGGIEPVQRKARYHEMAWIEDRAVEKILYSPPVDVLLTHQGPAEVQGEIGSPTLNILLNDHAPRSWFHGHGANSHEICECNRCTIVPLGDIAFGGRGHHAGDPGIDGYAQVELSDMAVKVSRDEPAFWREYRQKNWLSRPEGLVSPDLVPYLDR